MAAKKPKVFSIDDVLGEAVPARLELAAGKVIEMTCWPDAVSVELADKLMSEGCPVRALAEAVCEFVKEWDFSLEEGKVFPLEVNALCKMRGSAVFLRRVIDAVQAVKSPNATTSA